MAERGVEMKEVKYVLTAMKKNSVIIMDELCRSTSVEEGTALAMAIVEKMARSSAYIYVTTHYNMLTKLYDMYPNVKVWQMETIPSGNDPRTFQLDFKYNLLSGVNMVKHYSAYIVRNIWPDSIVRHIYEMLDKLSEKKSSEARIVSFDERARLKYAIEAEFRKLKSQKKLNISEFHKLLNQYQSELQKFGYLIEVNHLSEHRGIEDIQTNNASMISDNLPDIRHSILDISISSSRVEDDAIKRMRQVFTPSIASQQFGDDKRSEEGMTEMFTPEPQNYQQLLQPQQDMEDMRYNNNFQYINDSTHLDLNFENRMSQHFENIYEEKDGYRDLDIFHEPNTLHGYIDNRQSNIFKTHNQKYFDDKSQSSDSEMRYINTSKFLAESSENINKLVPEISIYEISEDNENENSKKSLQLFSNTHCPNSKFYSHNNVSPNISMNHSASVEGYDMASVKEDLEICSKILEEDGDFEEPSVHKETVGVESESDNNFYPKNSYIKYISPKVRIIVGSNDKSISFGEEDTKGPNKIRLEINQEHRQITNSVNKETTTNAEDIILNEKKINIISNIAITSSGRVQEIDRNFDVQEKTKEIIGKSNERNISEELSQGLLESFLETDIEEEISNLNITENENSSESKINSSCNRDESNAIDHNNIYKKNIPNVADSTYGDIDSDKVADKKISPVIIDDSRSCSSDNYKIEVMVGKTMFGGYSQESKSTESKNREGANFGGNGSSNKVETNVTTISEASKLRNLDPSTSDSSKNENSSSKKITTSSSSASKKRNQISSSPVLTNPKESDESSSPKRSVTTGKGLGEIGAVDKDSNKESLSSHKESDGGVSSLRKKKSIPLKKFKPPRILTRKEIQEEFELQDRKLLECSNSDSTNLSKYLGQLMNRPSVEQIRNTTHLALVRKTNEGLQIIPAEPTRKKPKSTNVKRHYSNEGIDISMFSDKNAKPFEEYLNSNEKDFKKFHLNFNKKVEEDGKIFKFQPIQETFGDYTENSTTKYFSRTYSHDSNDRKIDSNLESSYSCIRSQSLSKFTQESTKQSLTPDGYYKQNKQNIMHLVDKYLNTSSQKYTQEPNYNMNSIGKFNIFENNFPSNEEF